jgi:hypothetical protein
MVDSSYVVWEHLKMAKFNLFSMQDIGIGKFGMQDGKI